MKNIPKQAYTTEFKELAVKRVTDGASIAVVVKELGLSDQTLRNWIKAAVQGKLKGVGSKVVTPEAMELFRLRAEVARLTRENEIIKKAAVGSTGHCNASASLSPGVINASVLRGLVLSLFAMISSSFCVKVDRSVPSGKY